VKDAGFDWGIRQGRVLQRGQVSTLDDNLASRCQIQCGGGENADHPIARRPLALLEFFLRLLVNRKKLLPHVFAYCIAFIGSGVRLKKGTKLDPLLQLSPQQVDLVQENYLLDRLMRRGLVTGSGLTKCA